MDSYDVRFFDIKKLGNGTAARYRVRWAVDGREHCKSFKARHLADRFLDGLKDAVRFRRPFDPRTGLPGAETTGDELISWYAHARSYGEAKWGCGRRCSARHSTRPPASSTRRRPRLGRTRLAARRRAGRHRHRAAGAGRLRHDPDGKAAAGSTQRRKRSVFYNALGYAVEQGHLPANRSTASSGPPRRRPERRPARRRQPRAGLSLLAAVRALSGRDSTWKPSSPPVLRRAAPSEAVMLRDSDLHLSKRGGGGSSWPPPPLGRARPGLITAPHGRNAA